ncbi:hypothetical protein [Streptosporangium sp. NPDC051022]|uniref:hypothetical protein n=1 Tax=Streptosporangium sp. NPDC051022 TaxID=3155752 RepID=UPI003418FF4F
MSTPSSGPQWSGDMLDRPEMVKAFADQLRRSLSEQAAWLDRIRRDAEAMWEANPPQGYGSFEAWWRHRWVTGPFGEIQAHLEKAAALTFALEARYRRGRHEIPATRQATAQARQQQALTRGTTNTASRPAPPRAAEPRAPAAPQSGGDFMDLIRRDRSA